MAATDSPASAKPVKWRRVKGWLSGDMVIAGNLVAEINAEHTRAFGKAQEVLQHARHCGELLLQAKAAVGHGEWLLWVEAHCKFSERTAQGYMRLASRWEELQTKSATAADLPLSDALKLLSEAGGRLDELEEARRFDARAEVLRQRARADLGIAGRILADPEASVEDIVWCVNTAGRCENELQSLNIEAERGAGQCLISLRKMTGLDDETLLEALNSGALMGACAERMEQLKEATAR